MKNSWQAHFEQYCVKDLQQLLIFLIFEVVLQKYADKNYDRRLFLFYSR